MSRPPPYPPLLVRRTIVRTQNSGQGFPARPPGLRVVRHLASQPIPAAAIGPEEPFALPYPYPHYEPLAACAPAVLHGASPIPMHVNGRAMGIPPFSPLVYEVYLSSYDEGLQDKEGPEDLVACFCCGLSIQDWRPTDDPFVEHARWSKDCHFLQETKGHDYILAVSIAMADISGSGGEAHPVSEVMKAQRLPGERMRAYDVTGHERLPAVHPSSQYGLGIHSAAAASVSVTGGRTEKIKHKVDWTAVSDQHAYEALRKSHYELICKLKCKEVTAILFENGILSETDMNSIQRTELRSSMDAQFDLLAVVRSKDKLGFKQFSDALFTTKQHNLYDKVMNNLREMVPQAFGSESGARRERT